MNTYSYSSLLLIMSLLMSCINTKESSHSSDATLNQTIKEEKLTKVDNEETAKMENQYLNDAIYLTIKSDSGIVIDTGDQRIKHLEKSPLKSIHDRYPIREISKPMLALKPNLYRLTFQEEIDLLQVIETLQSYPFVEYAELIPINK